MVIPTKDIVCYEIDNDVEQLVLCPMCLDGAQVEYEIFHIRPLTKENLVESYDSGSTICCDHLGCMIEQI